MLIFSDENTFKIPIERSEFTKRKGKAILCFANHVFVSWKLKIMSQTTQFLAVSTVHNRYWGIPLQSSD